MEILQFAIQFTEYKFKSLSEDFKDLSFIFLLTKIKQKCSNSNIEKKKQQRKKERRNRQHFEREQKAK